MTQMRKAVAGEAHIGMRVDRFLAETFGISRAAAERLLADGQITVDGGAVAKNYRLRGGEELRLIESDPVPTEAQPEDLPLDIVYEDADIVVVNKPAGMVVHPAAGNESGTLVNALLHHCGGTLSGVGGVVRPGIVHRIDKDTSGLLVVAKNDAAHNALSEQLRVHDVYRIYSAIALGNLREDRGTICAPIARHPVDRKKMAVARRSGEGREAITHFEVLERFRQFTYLRCQLETGRTHQIRVHLASKGHPLLGDPVYGGDGTRFQAHHRTLFCGQCLHAGELTLTHPKTGERMTFQAPLPPNFDAVLQLLRKEAL